MSIQQQMNFTYGVRFISNFQCCDSQINHDLHNSENFLSTREKLQEKVGCQRKMINQSRRVTAAYGNGDEAQCFDRLVLYIRGSR